MPLEYWKFWKNSTLYVVIVVLNSFHSSLFSFFFLFFLHLFFLSFCLFSSSLGATAPSPLNWRPWEGQIETQSDPQNIHGIDAWNLQGEYAWVCRVRSASFALGLHTYLLTFKRCIMHVRRVLKKFRNWISRHNYIASGSAFQLLKKREWRVFATMCLLGVWC